MTYPPSTLLIADNDTSENLAAIKLFLHGKGLTNEDVKILRRGKLLELRVIREVTYG